MTSRKGTISVETFPQRGTTFTIRIPLAYAVAQVLLVRVDRQMLAVPLKLVKHISEFGPEDVKQNGNGPMLEFESGSFPVRFLADHISVGPPAGAVPDYSNTLLIETDDTRCALLVDEILKTEEVAIKPLGRPLENLKDVIGAAVLGSGDIVPILDLQYLLKNQPRENKPEKRRSGRPPYKSADRRRQPKRPAHDVKGNDERRLGSGHGKGRTRGI